MMFLYVVFGKYVHPNVHPKGALFFEKIALLETDILSFIWGKITTWQEVHAITAEYERSMKMHGAF